MLLYSCVDRRLLPLVPGQRVLSCWCISLVWTDCCHSQQLGKKGSPSEGRDTPMGHKQIAWCQPFLFSREEVQICGSQTNCLVPAFSIPFYSRMMPISKPGPVTHDPFFHLNAGIYVVPPEGSHASYLAAINTLPAFPHPEVGPFTAS